MPSVRGEAWLSLATLGDAPLTLGSWWNITLVPQHRSHPTWHPAHVSERGHLTVPRIWTRGVDREKSCVFMTRVKFSLQMRPG